MSSDLLSIADAARAESGGPVVAVGHSLGGNVVIGAALASPGAFEAIGAYEPPMPWLGFRRQEGRPWPAVADDPAEEAERFFGRMVGEGSWSRLTESGRAERRADGPALVADLRSMRGEAPLSTSPRSASRRCSAWAVRSRHRTTAAPSSGSGPPSPARSSYEIAGAQHGAHLRTRTTSPP